MHSLPLQEEVVAISAPLLGTESASAAVSVSFHIPFLHSPVRPAANQRQETRSQVSPWRQIGVEVYTTPPLPFQNTAFNTGTQARTVTANLWHACQK